MTVAPGPALRELPAQPAAAKDAARKALGDAPVIPLILIGTGAYLAWFGIHYWRRDIKWPTDPVKSVLQGHGLPAPGPAPSTGAGDISRQTATTPSGGGGGKGGGGGGGGGGATASVTGEMIADDAMKYNGHAYTFGIWDCSGFVNHVIGQDMRLAIPGDAHYRGPPPHGPDVAEWIIWSGVKHVSKARPGDLVAWGPNQHIGIAISSTHMISAENPQRGTRVDPFAGFAAGRRPLILRLRETLVTAHVTGPWTHRKLEALWRMAGGSPAHANVAAAVAQAESGGNPKATSPNPDGGTNVGLWQLDTRGKGAGHTIAALMQAITNARVAVKGSRNGRDWSAWATYVSGAYRQYLT